MIEKEYYTLEEIAELFKVSKHTVYSWVKKGKLKGTKIASLLRFTPSQVEEFIKESNKDKQDYFIVTASPAYIKASGKQHDFNNS